MEPHVAEQFVPFWRNQYNEPHGFVLEERLNCRLKSALRTELFHIEDMCGGSLEKGVFA